MAWETTPVSADMRVLDAADGRVECVPRRKKVACVGFATNTLSLVPWTDPSFEIWSMNQGHLHCQRRTDRHFEMHLPDSTPDIRDPNYMQWLKDLTIPIYMIQQYDYAPTSVRYPIERAIAYNGEAGDYFMSTVAYMLALAGMEGFEEVHLYGINLAIGDEYFYEKPNAEHWIGYLRGKGIKVVIPQASALCKQFLRYGYHVDARPYQNLKVLLTARQTEYRAKIEKLQAEGNTFLGALRETEALMQIFEGMQNGADVVLQYGPAPSS